MQSCVAGGAALGLMGTAIPVRFLLHRNPAEEIGARR